MRVDLEELDLLAEALEDPAFDETGVLDRASGLVQAAAQRVRELLSALAEVRVATSHRQAVEAAQRGIAGDPQARIWTQAEIDAAHPTAKALQEDNADN